MEIHSKIFEYPRSDFKDFSEDREEECIKVGQIWAVFDNKDAMPRFYARILKVFSPGFNLKITWLDPDPDDEDELEWFVEGLPISCGKFKNGPTQDTHNHSMFSHLMLRENGGDRDTLKIIPRKGQTWALFKNWDIKWKSSDLEYEYEFVEILSEYSEGVGVCVAYLGKVMGFASVFCRISEGGRHNFLITPHELYRFSHMVPSFKLTGKENTSVPKGSLELDPAALPRNIEEISVSKDSHGLPRNTEEISVSKDSHGLPRNTEEISVPKDSHASELARVTRTMEAMKEVLEQMDIRLQAIERATPNPNDLNSVHDGLVDRNLGNLKLENSHFRGKSDPKAYLQWEKKMEHIFDCHQFIEEKRVMIALSQFSDFAIVWWDQFRKRNLEYPIETWHDLKTIMRKRFVPGHFHREMVQKLQGLKQGRRSVDDYYKKMEMIMTWAGIEEDMEATMARFLAGLNREISDGMILKHFAELEELVHIAIEVEKKHQRRGSTGYASRPYSRSISYRKKDEKGDFKGGNKSGYDGAKGKADCLSKDKSKIEKKKGEIGTDDEEEWGYDSDDDELFSGSMKKGCVRKGKKNSRGDKNSGSENGDSNEEIGETSVRGRGLKRKSGKKGSEEEVDLNAENGEEGELMKKIEKPWGKRSQMKRQKKKGRGGKGEACLRP